MRRASMAFATASLVSVATVAVITATAGPAIAQGAAYGGYSTGTEVYANAVNAKPGDLAKLALGLSAAGVGVHQPLVTRDRLQSPLLVASGSGKNAYGHGSALNLGLGQSQSAAPQVSQSRSEATSPPAGRPVRSNAGSAPGNPVLTGTLLPSSASASTTTIANACVSGVISSGAAHVADAKVLSVPNGGATTTVVTLGNTVDTGSQDALGAPLGRARGHSLATQTVQHLAPVTLFAGTPAALTITALAPIELRSVAGGAPGTAGVAYGFAGIPPTNGTIPVLSIASASQRQKLTSQQLFGNGGVRLALGVVDVTIATPAHSLAGLEGTSPAVAKDGTTASAAADFIRVTVPGSFSTPQQNPVGGPLGQVLNPVLNPVVTGLKPLLTQLQSGMQSAGLTLADVRVGHMEAAVNVPAGGIVCTAAAPAAVPAAGGGATITTNAPAAAGQTLPNTGGSPLLPVIGLALLTAGGLLLRRRLRARAR